MAYREPDLLPRFRLHVKRTTVKRVSLLPKVVTDPRNVRQGLPAHPQREVQNVPPLVCEKVLLQILDQLRLGAYARVADAWLYPPPAVKDAQQIYYVWFADSFHLFCYFNDKLS